MRYWVYVHTCPNGKKYVGCTKQISPNRRWLKGRGYSSQFFGKAILKYGWDNITHEVFEVETEEKMYQKEAELVLLYRSNNPLFGYNCTEGGEGCPGHTVSEEAREKMRKAKEGWKGNETSWKEGHTPWNKGKVVGPHTEEWKVKVSLKNRGRINKEPKSPEHRKKLSESHKGVSHPQPKYQYLFPDGTVKMLMPSTAKRWYINKGIEIVKVN